MVNPKHIAILKSGREGYNRWRSENPREALDIGGADLRGTDLSGMDLRGVWFVHPGDWGTRKRCADLRGTNLNNANLLAAKLRGTDLRNATIVGGNLYGADLVGADLRGTDLTNADLSFVVLSDEEGVAANLAGANLTNVTFTKEGDSSEEGGFLELAAADGVESATFASSEFLFDYLHRAFEYAHMNNTAESRCMPVLIRRSIENIKALRTLFDVTPTRGLIDTVSFVDKELVRRLAANTKSIYELHSRQFEELVAELLKDFGWDVELTAPSKDGGYDIFAVSKDTSGLRTSWIVECKRYSPQQKVGVEIVRSLYGVKASLGGKAANAMLATTSYFTKGVNAFKASRYDLELRDYDGIVDWLRAYGKNPSSRR